MMLLKTLTKPTTEQQTFQQNDVDCDRKPKSLAAIKCS